MEQSGGKEALNSLLWTLSPYSPPTEDEPEELVRLTPCNIVLAVLPALLQTVVYVSAKAYMLVRAHVQRVSTCNRQSSLRRTLVMYHIHLLADMC
jgi:hypothetical protein